MIAKFDTDSRKWLDDIAVKRFDISYWIQLFSNKDMNTLVNNGHHSDEIIDYIDQLKKLTLSEISIENEVVEKFWRNLMWTLSYLFELRFLDK